MIKFTINGTNVECPVSWDEITIKQYLGLKKSTNISEVFKALTGVELDIDEEQLERDVFPFLTFIADKPDFDKLPVPEKLCSHPVLKNLGHGTFQQKISAQRIIHNAFKDKPKSVDVTSFMVELLDVYIPKYSGIQVKDFIFVEAYPVFNHYCNEIVRLVNRDKQFLEGKSDPDLNLAGVQALTKFGEMRIIDSLAGGDLLKYNEILSLEYDVIFKKLWYEKEKEELYERLRKVKQRKAKQAA